MTSRYDYLGGRNSFLNDDFREFRNCRFGVRAPVKNLEPGITLLVKCLPALGVMTCYACSGHRGRGPVMLGFPSYWHYHWFLFLKDELGLLGPFLQGLGEQSKELGFCYGWSLPTEDQPRSPDTLWWELQQAARGLLRPGLNDLSRRIKATLDDEDTFPPAAEPWLKEAEALGFSPRPRQTESANAGIDPHSGTC